MASTASTTELSVLGESLQRLYHDFISDRFMVNRRYQRKLVWAVEEKQKLIDSVLQGLPIPLILLAESQESGFARREVIDGLQRLNAIFSFIENEFDVDGSYFDLEALADTKLRLDKGILKQRSPILSRDVCSAIANYQLPVSTYRSASGPAVDEVFRRINSSGRHLSLHEIRQAGATDDIAGVIRRLSATIRGDASLSDYVDLGDMPKISITNNHLSYGIFVDDIFWVREGILTRELVRESRDEELVLDIVMDMILPRLASTGPRYRDAVYGIDRGVTATSGAVVHRHLQVLGAEEVERRFLETLEVFQAALAVANTNFAELTVTQQNRRGVPRHFHALFVSVAALMHQENLDVMSAEKLSRTLSGFWDADLKIPSGGGDWGAKRKEDLFSMIRARLRPHFRPKVDEDERRVQERATQFEAMLNMALTEDAMFELKQGFCRVNDPTSFDNDSFDKVLRTASAMANMGPEAIGYIVFGVADDAYATTSIERLCGISTTRHGEFHITGTQHELTALNKSADEMWRELITKISNSKLDSTFSTVLAKALRPFRYKNHLLWNIEVKAMASPVTYDGNFFERVGPTTQQVTGNDLIRLVQRFPVR